MTDRAVNLQAIARDTLLRFGFSVDIPPEALIQTGALKEPDFASLGVRDLSGWLWSSIDNDAFALTWIRLSIFCRGSRRQPAVCRNCERRRICSVKFSARPSRAAQHDLALHRCPHLSDAAGKIIDGSHVPRRKSETPGRGY